MLIVIAITGIILAMTMNFGAKRIQDLRFQSAKTQFINGFENLQSYALSTNYLNQERFKYLEVKLWDGTTKLAYRYTPIWKDYYEEAIEKEMTISNIEIEDESYDEVVFQFKPYIVGCSLTGENLEHQNGTVKFQLELPEQKKIYCFEITTDNCVLREEKCNRIPG